MLGLWSSISKLAALGRAVATNAWLHSRVSHQQKKVWEHEPKEDGDSPELSVPMRRGSWAQLSPPALAPNRDKAGNSSDCNKLVIVFEERD